jgi:rRNA maturation endonuclease Nob1
LPCRGAVVYDFGGKAGSAKSKDIGEMDTSLPMLARLRADLQGIETDLGALVEISPVKWFSNDSGYIVVIGAADFYFTDPEIDQLRLQIALKRRRDRWMSHFDLVYKNPPPQLKEEIREAKEGLDLWISLGSHNYKLISDQKTNAELAREACSPFCKFLDLLEGGPGEIIIVPDTNAIIASPDPTSYEEIAGTKEFTFVLLPTVLQELDNLKNHHRDSAFREKVSKVVGRIKGWRHQGSLRTGVTVSRSIHIKLVAEEPNFKSTLPWLDPSNNDDRIIASTLEVQVDSPSAKVVLVTSDINLQNKADAAMLPCLETP